MSASLAADAEPRFLEAGCCTMSVSRERVVSSEELISRKGAVSPESSQQPSGDESPHDIETKQAIRELLDVLPKDVLEELNAGTIDLKDEAFLDGLVDHISRLTLASPRMGQKILPKIKKVKKLISRSLRESDPDVRVSATVTRSTARVGRNDACPCGSGKKYKQCCLRKEG